ncbi:chromosomal replication initiator protein DnaA [Aliarcobacter cibarius]|jgi:chromosomal replication initiator protein|uniref:Chromosomal replication initiator protein DnaA n=1 Tax=Aliarcobacter cibarius TaxID=255507 RepID=A0A5J6RHH3_9BACT|nr:chromosomal replication initiator protein DnaA [Aliarcobacter cibarius]QEZ88208.1 chromosomal replication initiator protein [Aliarcobacter cibarius]QKJ26004.1 chromosomal replication initiator protein [Aliarcobacter cibarius]TLT00252.1 chromosomal replication initiator protein DnaA [Aliarcobacter cibarius]TLT00569.1 chromosomal replication initiator protein DnaA [Aliarcobacter cibarius]TLT05158.1 chromosomal replication initiator protein DnaA [Aliarcobacter cibarius]
MTSKDFLTIIQKESNKSDYDRYLKQLVYKKVSSDENIAIFEVNNKYIASWIKSKFTDLIQHCFEIYNGSKPKIEIRLAGEKKTKKEILKEQVENETSESTILNPSYTFDSFVVGPSNQMAYNASLAVANKPGIQYNPLFIYGGTGLGKTHLLQAIGNHALEKGKTVIYVTIEQFMNDFTFSIKNKNMEHFRAKYRNCDVLLIDDVQFLSGKEQTQEEFFHTFNELHNAKKQIVMTSDRLPSQIAGLVDRLRSRFEWGLTADVQIPGLETKIAIIEKKSDLNGIKLSKEIINFIATSLDNSIREIEGVIIRINASASLLNQEINLAMVQGLLKEQIKENKENIKLPDIINIVSSELNIKPSDIKSKKRTAAVANARRVVIYLVRELTHNSMPDIAKVLGMKDHSSISHNIKKANELMEQDENFKLVIQNLKNKIINKE